MKDCYERQQANRNRLISDALNIRQGHRIRLDNGTKYGVHSELTVLGEEAGDLCLHVTCTVNFCTFQMFEKFG